MHFDWWSRCSTYGVVLHYLWGGASTVDEYSTKNVIPRISRQLQGWTSIYVLWDKYREDWSYAREAAHKWEDRNKVRKEVFTEAKINVSFAKCTTRVTRTVAPLTEHITASDQSAVGNEIYVIHAQSIIPKCKALIAGHNITFHQNVRQQPITLGSLKGNILSY